MEGVLGRVLEKLQSWHVFGKSFDIAIADEAQDAYFFKTQLHALLNAGGKIFRNAYRKRVLASLLLRADCDNVMLE